MANSANDVINNYLKKNEEKMLYICQDVKDKNDDRITYYNAEMTKRGWKVQSKKMLADVFDVTLDCHVTYVREINKKGDENVGEYKPFTEVLVGMEEGDIIEPKLKHYSAIKLSQGQYYYWNEAVGNKSVVGLNKTLTELEFRIRPRYVSQEKAFQVLSEGGVIKGYDNDGGCYEFSHDDSIEDLFHQYPALNISDIVKFKWTIVG